MEHSNFQKIVSGWLELIGESAGQKFHLDADGVCLMQYENDLRFVVEVPHDHDKVYLYGPLTTLDPQGQDRNLLYNALALNLFQLETNGGTLAVDQGTQEIIYCLVEPIAGQDFNSFQDTMNRFVASSHKLRQDLTNEGSHPHMGTEVAEKSPISKSAGFIPV